MSNLHVRDLVHSDGCLSLDLPRKVSLCLIFIVWITPTPSVDLAHKIVYISPLLPLLHVFYTYPRHKYKSTSLINLGHSNYIWASYQNIKEVCGFWDLMVRLDFLLALQLSKSLMVSMDLALLLLLQVLFSFFSSLCFLIWVAVNIQVSCSCMYIWFTVQDLFFFTWSWCVFFWICNISSFFDQLCTAIITTAHYYSLLSFTFRKERHILRYIV